MGGYNCSLGKRAKTNAASSCTAGGTSVDTQFGFRVRVSETTIATKVLHEPKYRIHLESWIMVLQHKVMQDVSNQQSSHRSLKSKLHTH